MDRGKLIVFEGVDGSGKSTLAKALYEDLKAKGKEVILTCQPSKDTSVGLSIRNIVLDTTLDDINRNALFKTMLFIADRFIHYNEIIAPALEQGKIVICDRWIYSTMAYQSTFNSTMEKELETLKYCLFKSVEFTFPDVMFYCTAHPIILGHRLSLKKLDVIEKNVINDFIAIENAYINSFTEFGPGYKKCVDLQKQWWTEINTGETSTKEALNIMISKLIT